MTTDAQTPKLMAALQRCEVYDTRLAHEIAAGLARGTSREAALAAAETALADTKPSAADRFDAIRAEVQLRREARATAAAPNPALEAMAGRSR